MWNVVVYLCVCVCGRLVCVFEYVKCCAFVCVCMSVCVSVWGVILFLGFVCVSAFVYVLECLFM